MLFSDLTVLHEHQQMNMRKDFVHKKCSFTGRFHPSWPIVGKVGHMLLFCTGAGTHTFQIASKGLQYRVKRRVLEHIRPPFTLQKFQCSIETIFAF